MGGLRFGQPNRAPEEEVVAICFRRVNLSFMRTGWICVSAAWFCIFGCTNQAASNRTHGPSAESTRHLSRHDLVWQPLNPARGDQSPKAANLWGDLRTNQATGFLVQFVDGFSSPPHVHNVTYRGVVIEGLIHNDDPNAPERWMGLGSYWVQPAGDVHITSSKGKSIAYIEIGSGPYLVHPPKQAFEADDQAINVGFDEIVWQEIEHGERVVPFGQTGPERTLFRWNPKATIALSSRTPATVVIIRGPVLHEGNNHPAESLAPGSLVAWHAGTQHLHCASDSFCLAYCRKTAASDQQQDSKP